MKTKTPLAATIALTGALTQGAIAAEELSLPTLITLSQGIVAFDLAPEGDESPLEATRGSIMLLDGSTLAIRSPDGSTPLAELLDDRQATLLFEEAPGTLSASSGDLAGLALMPPGDAAPPPFTISTLVESRPLTLGQVASTEGIATPDSVTLTFNDEPFTLRLPEGSTLADFSGTTPITLVDADGRVLLDERSLASLSGSEANAFAARLGLLDVDMALRAAQKQAMAQSVGVIGQQIDTAMHPHREDHFGRQEGLYAWVASEYRDMQGRTGNGDYEGEGSLALFGVETRRDNLLAGVSLGYGQVSLDSRSGRMTTDLGGTLIAPYGALSLADGRLVLDAILLYQSLDGTNQASYRPEDLALDGHRWGGRASGTYYLPAFGSALVGLTAGGLYLEDDLEGHYLGTTSDYGIELGELFAGATLSVPFATGRLQASLIHHHDVTTDFDRTAEVLDAADGRTELALGVSHELANGLDVTLQGRTVIGSSDTEFHALQASMAYRF